MTKDEKNPISNCSNDKKCNAKELSLMPKFQKGETKAEIYFRNIIREREENPLTHYHNLTHYYNRYPFAGTAPKSNISLWPDEKRSYPRSNEKRLSSINT